MNRTFLSFTFRRSFAALLSAGSALGAMALFTSSASAQAPATPPTAAPAAATMPATTAAPDAAHIAALEKMLSGSTLVGQFTVSGNGEVKPREERYELASVKHIQGDTWLITARIKYGETDATVPLPLPIRWAGETPVITLDNFAVPGMGAYSARVMFYEDRYMGYWSSANKDHGGYMFGVIEHPKADAPAEAKDAKAQAPNDAPAAK